MLQQTPVVRVLPAYDAWMRRWPTPAALAAEAPGEAVRMWGRLGYPRRALRLHAAATAIDAEHDGELPTTYAGLRALPGVGDYTANAILAFAHRQRAAVLDTNVRRVHARLFGGAQFPPTALTAAERRLGDAVLPDDAETAATWSVAVMELGALVCQARSPRCTPARWPTSARGRRRASPPTTAPPGRARRTPEPTARSAGGSCRCFGTATTRSTRRRPRHLGRRTSNATRALASLLDDGLVVERPDGMLALP